MPAATETLITYAALPSRVLFGPGARARLADEVRRLGCRRVLLVDGLLTDTASELAAALGDAHAGTLTVARQHVPSELVGQALETLGRTRADGLVALGGGSAVGVAKALARETGLAILAVPTTYAGSEMTPIWGITTDARKTTGRDLTVLPRTVVYDPELTVSFPARASAASGMNAIAHCVEALWSAQANPVTDAIATDGIALLARSLRAVVAHPENLEARSDALRGAWLGGIALAGAGTALHHRICHVLGGTFDLPHADVHAAVLPAVTDHFRAAAPRALARVAGALDEPDAVVGLERLTADLGLGAGLAALGLEPAGAGLAAELTADGAASWPAPVDVQDVRRIIDHAMTSVSQREEQSCPTE